MEKKKFNLTTILLIMAIIAIIIMAVVLIISNGKNDDKTSDNNNTTNAISNNVENSSQSVPKEETKNSQTTTNNKVDINDYIGMWYENKDLIGYSNACLSLDENNNILLEAGIYRATGLDEQIVNLTDNKIVFNNGDGFSGTLTLGDNKITMNYSISPLNISNQEIELTYKKVRSSTELLSGFDITGNWEPRTATRNGEDISLQEIYGTGIRYGGYLTLNSDNTYSRLIGITSDEITNDLTGTYKILGNKIIFTTKNGNKEEAKFEMGIIAYDYGEGVTVNFYPKS
ncbi:MAG: hypothetical protein IKF97_00555 [Clostridia bacterium]|nr:hypothetical protein [Clostridia bacterium]